MNKLLLLLAVLWCLPASATTIKRGPGGSGTSSYQNATDCALVLTAPTGSFCQDLDSNALYVCEVGPCSGTNAWTAYVSAGGLASTDIDTCSEISTIVGAAERTGTCGDIVLSSSPTLVTPVLGVASATSLATSAASPLLLTNGQLVTIALTSQTTGGTTLTIPDFASVADEFTFKTKSQTMSNKTFVAPALGTPASGVMTNVTGTAAGLTAGAATALAANGANCSAGNYPLGVDASGAVESCTLASGSGTVTGLTGDSGAATDAAVPAVLGASTDRGGIVTASEATTDTVRVELKYANLAASNLVMNAKECVFTTNGTSGGGFLCEGSAGSNANEPLFIFPAIDTETTNVIVTGSGTTAVPTGFQITGTPDGTKFLRDDGVWTAGAGGLASTDIDSVGELLAITDYETGTGALVFGTTPTLTTPVLSGKVDAAGSTNDDSCASDQSNFWWDATDSQFDFCELDTATVPLTIAPLRINGADIWWDTDRDGTMDSDEPNLSKFAPLGSTTDLVVAGNGDFGGALTSASLTIAPTATPAVEFNDTVAADSNVEAKIVGDAVADDNGSLSLQVEDNADGTYKEGLRVFSTAGATVTQLGNATTSFAVSEAGIMTNTSGTGAGAITLGSTAPQVVLGTNTSVLGSIKLFGSTSGDATIKPNVVAGTATSVTLPAVSGTLPVIIASGAVALDTDAIASTACDTSDTAITATGVASTDVLTFSFNADVTAITGYAPAVAGALIIYAYPSTDAVNFKVCNPTSSSVTPGSAVTLNWRVTR